MKLQEKITKLFYMDKLKPSDIAKKLKISKSTITRYIKVDPRYKEEKKNRKLDNKNKNIEFTKKYMKKKRKNSIDDYIIMKRQHE